jgi:predicted phosphodiesterase
MTRKAFKTLAEAVNSGDTASESSSRVRSLQRELEATKKLLEDQQERIERIAAAKFTIPTQRAAKTGKGSFVRLIIPDTHGTMIDPRAAAAMFADMEYLKPKEIVHLGDAIDCGGFLAQHHVWGYVAEADYTFEQDVAAANAFFDRLQELAPKATIHYLEGNHDRRIETWCVTQALRSRIDAAYLKKMFGVSIQLHIEKRGIHHWEQGKKYMGCRVPATIRLGNCFFTHGTKHGKNAASAMLSRFSGNVVFGHVHKLLSASDRTVKDGGIGAWCPGSLCHEQPLWRHSDPTDWCQGYGVQLVRPCGDFLHINVPIIDGKSYLVNLLGKAG